MSFILKKNVFPSSKKNLCAKFDRNRSSGSVEKDERTKNNVKRLTDRRMNWQNVIRKAHMNFHLWWAEEALFLPVVFHIFVFFSLENIGKTAYGKQIQHNKT